MAEFDLEDLEKINQKQEIIDFLVDKGIIKEKKFKEQLAYEKKLDQLQFELLKLQAKVINEKLKVLVIFEGRDAAGKGGAIERVIGKLNPKAYRVVSLSKPTETENLQWYFQRYIAHLPKSGELVFFDRSYYNRAVVEPVFGFCTPEQHNTFMAQVLPLENIWQKDGIILIKLFLNIDKEEQAKRLQDREDDPLKQFKIGSLDQQAQEKWEVYTKYINEMLKNTSDKTSPWIEIDANNKKNTRLTILQLLNNIINGKEFSTKNYESEIKLHD